MTMFQNGSAQPGTPAANTIAWTPGKYVQVDGITKVTPCSVTGEGCDFIFNDTIEAVENGMGVGLLAPWLGGGPAIAGLAGGAVDQGDEVCITVAGGVPKFTSADLAEVGAKIVGKVIYGSATTADVVDAYGAYSPSLAILLYPPSAQRDVADEDMS